MLTELKLANFRIFDDEVTVRFRPITVFIGRNSSGKSSIIKFLLMLQQSIDSGKPQFLSPDGNKVNLGIFDELKNSLTQEQDLRFELSVQSFNHIPGAISEFLVEDIEPNALLYKTSAKVPYNEGTNTGSIEYSLIDRNAGKNFAIAEDNIREEFTFLDRVSTFKLAKDEEGTVHITMESGERVIREDAFRGRLRSEIRSIRHLDPVKGESESIFLVSPPPTDYVGQRGQHTLNHLHRMTSENGDGYEFILPYLQNVAGIEGVVFDTLSKNVVQTTATNKTTRANVLIGNYGFGVSQCLPIFVQGAIMSPHTMLMIEQPEAQLHPTAQLELGSFFADLWKQRKVGSIVETHSGNILLRLRRLIATGDLSPEDVSVAFFTFDEDNKNMPIIENLDIGEDGSMQPGLPMEFFGADVIEGLRLGARA